MPKAPKESAKQRKAREKREKFLTGQATERQDREVLEDKSRQQVELQARAERTEILLQFHQALVDPAARLMVPMTQYEALRGRMQREGELSASRVVAMQAELRRMQRSGEALTQELVHLRHEVRQLCEGSTAKLKQIQDKAARRLEEFINAMELSIMDARIDVAESGQFLNKALEEARIQHVETARRAQESAVHITTYWQEQTSMHTRIPPRIRNHLFELEKGEIIAILDTLSFDESARKLLLYKYPPGPDMPFGRNEEGVRMSTAESLEAELAKEREVKSKRASAAESCASSPTPADSAPDGRASDQSLPPLAGAAASGQTTGAAAEVSGGAAAGGNDTTLLAKAMRHNMDGGVDAVATAAVPEIGRVRPARLD